MNKTAIFMCALGLSLGVTACGDDKDDGGTTGVSAGGSGGDGDASGGDGDSSGGDGDSSGGDGDSSGGDGDSSGGDGDSSGGSDGGGDGDGDSDGGGSVFIVEPDGGGTGIECDIWNQDCPDGQKCMPWANDGGNSWNATKCSPVNANPKQPGDACAVEGSGVAGVDDCDVSSMCWNSDENGMGTCIAFCEGSADAPTCADPDTGCSITNDGVLILCLPKCDPLLQDCPGNMEVCYPVNEGFQCAPDASGEDAGGYGDPCEFINACDAGLFCAAPANVPGCTAGGCCSEFCDLSSGDGDSQCSGNGGGQMCSPWFEEGTTPPGLEEVGGCIIPM